jgi:hypothetical protein
MREEHFAHELVEYIPERIEDGVLYVSHRYKTAVHKCACGCGKEVVTPLSPADWRVRFEDGGATLDPSIGNWSFACRSHYFIWAGKVVWARGMSQAAIERNRAFDAKIREKHLKSINAAKRVRRVRAAWNELLQWFKQ